jgi:hypothetical protein
MVYIHRKYDVVSLYYIYLLNVFAYFVYATISSISIIYLPVINGYKPMK